MVSLTEKLASYYDVMPHIYIGAVYGMYDSEKLVDLILHEDVLKDATFQVQLHKIIWHPEKRGV